MKYPLRTLRLKNTLGTKFKLDKTLTPQHRNPFFKRIAMRIHNIT